MAKHNYLDITGLVDEIEENGVILSVIQRDRNSWSFSKVWVKLEKEVLEEITINDILRVTGFLATKDIVRSSPCPKCGKENTRKEAMKRAKSAGTLSYVYAINVIKMASLKSKEASYEFLFRYCNMNKVFLVGAVLADPAIGSINGTTFCRYPMAINRTNRWRTKDKRKDYPWIYCYGEKAIREAERLKKNDQVLIDGVLQSRDYKETFRCTSCGELYSVPGRTLEVVSLRTERL